MTLETKKGISVGFVSSPILLRDRGRTEAPEHPSWEAQAIGYTVLASGPCYFGLHSLGLRGVDSSLESPEAETQGEPQLRRQGRYSQLPWASVGGRASRAGIAPRAKWGDPCLGPAVGASPACDLSHRT